MAFSLQNIKKKSLLIIAGVLLLAGLCSTVCVQAQENTAGKTVSQNKFQRLINKKNTILLDVRTEVEYKAGHIPGSIQIDFLKTDDFKKQVAVLDKSKPYLLYCRSGKRSKDAMTVMKEMGFTKLFDLQGGFNSWEGVKEQ